MKKFILPVLISATVLGSCSSSETPSTGQVPVTRKEMQSEVVKTVANLSIEGMTCSSGCGGKIQQELRSLKGVKTTDLDFVENRPQNVVTVEYNPKEISEQEMIKTVDAIESGNYEVKSVEILQYTGLQGTGGSSSSNSDINSGNGINKVFQLLNLFQSFNNLVQ